MVRKKLFLVLCAALFLTVFGCVVFPTVNENDFLELKSKYAMYDSFNTNIFELNNYLNELSALRGENTGFLSNVIDLEIASVNTFINFSKALDESKKISFFDHCNTIEYKNTISYLNATITYSNKAKSIVLLPNESNLLMSNQIDIVDGFGRTAKELLWSLKETC